MGNRVGHESVQVWVPAEGCVGVTLFAWCDKVHMGAINRCDGNSELGQSWSVIVMRCYGT